MRAPVVHLILRVLLWLLVGLLALILLLPVPLLFVTTAVPRLFTLGLAVVDLGLVAALLRLKRTWLTLRAFFWGVITTYSTHPIRN
ncbi:MAG: hypothetical protein NT075_08475 [Chloroflexi bacterium]|nr:hypothetical protein [Chloroflexota bacterium]